jgi:hypothetical protein
MCSGELANPCSATAPATIIITNSRKPVTILKKKNVQIFALIPEITTLNQNTA